MTDAPPKIIKSPFSGMDPYIEACGLWGDFHSHLIEKIGEKLADAAPEHYLVRTGERSYVVLVESEGMKNHPFLPDVSVTSRRGRKKTLKKGGTALAEPDREAEPVTMRAFIQEEHREAFVEIYETRHGQRLVTTIEVLSPSNKRPGTEGWELYQRKRQSLLLGNVNLVEIDLLRGGHACPWSIPGPTVLTRCWSPGPGANFAGSGAPTIAVCCPLFPCRWRSPTPISRSTFSR